MGDLAVCFVLLKTDILVNLFADESPLNRDVLPLHADVLGHQHGQQVPLTEAQCDRLEVSSESYTFVSLHFLHRTRAKSSRPLLLSSQ